MSGGAPPEIPEVIVVLGAALRPDGRPGPALARRADRGAALWRAAGAEGRAAALLVTGGPPNTILTEAAAMRARLMAAGVPDAAILVEARARDTEENARFAASLIRATGAARVTLVTDPWHMARARLCFALHGIGTRAAPTSPPPAPPARRILRRLREALATPRSAVLTMLRRGGPRG
ncbi:MAG: YdcF family protein [Pseudomonadota bacterium]|nr:YdcF family protein [Pseudomonadota bacterium]